MKPSTLLAHLTQLVLALLLAACHSHEQSPAYSYGYHESALEDLHADSPSERILDAFEDRAVEKLADWANYQAIITNRAYEIGLREHALVLAEGLFTDPSHPVPTKDLPFTAADRLPVAEYLNALLRVQGDSVHFELEEANLESGWREMDEGYRSTLAYRMTVRVWLDDAITFEQTMTESLPVSLLRIRKRYGTSTQESWQVMLGTPEGAR